MSLFMLPPNTRPNGALLRHGASSPRARARVLIAESDRAARLSLVAAVNADVRFELVGQAKDGAEALNRIERLAPDVVIMAMRMPKLLGREVVDALGGAVDFGLIFTSCPSLAGVRALHVPALDHLDLPADKGRIARALERAHSDYVRKASQERATPRTHDCAELTIKATDGRWHTLATNDIVRICAEQRCARIETQHGVYLVRKPLRALASRLGAQFVWQSRSEVVNVGCAHVAALPVARSV